MATKNCNCARQRSLHTEAWYSHISDMASVCFAPYGLVKLPVCLAGARVRYMATLHNGELTFVLFIAQLAHNV